MLVAYLSSFLPLTHSLSHWREGKQCPSSSPREQGEKVREIVCVCFCGEMGQWRERGVRQRRELLSRGPTLSLHPLSFPVDGGSGPFPVAICGAIVKFGFFQARI